MTTRWLLGVLLMATDALAADPERGVTRQLARDRAAQVSALTYRVTFELRPGAPRVAGRVEIGFKLADASKPVILDFRDTDGEGTVRDAAVNGKAIDRVRQVNGHVVLPAEWLRVGDNVASVGFEAGVAPAGRPLTSLTDREDGSEYVYSLFVPMDASLAFPCFDQPDLKAAFTLEVVAPKDWLVIANGPVESQADAGPKSRRTTFRATKPIPTYLFAFAAGPFVEVAAEAGEVPLRVFARKSRVERAKAESGEILRLTRAGMKHMAAFFDQPFPFPKYDGVLIPGFPYGGMEHAGATFFREDSLLFRAAPTADDRLNRATLILHELAHQWFGDLVTMRWFDDLWLKEGFAEYMAFHALATIEPPEKVWKRFHDKLKPAAYAIDATRGTTPIYQTVPNLIDAKSAYGAIVYSKAPSLLRSLAFVLGDDAFRDGVRLFLQRHRFANAEWADLIAAFESASGRPLKAWADAWVLQPGMPRVEVDWKCDDGKITRFELRQREVVGGKRLWPVKSLVMLAYDGAPPVRFTVTLDRETVAVAEAIGKPCPAYVLANDEDHAYGLFLLDERSRKAVGERVGEVPDPFLRSLLWGALWQAVREAEMPPADFVELSLKWLPDEDDEGLTPTILANVATALQRYSTPTQQDAIAPRLEALLRERMLKSESVGMRVTYFRAFRAMASAPESRAFLKELLAGKAAVPGVELKPLDRWQIVAALVARDDSDADSLLADERKRDATDDGRKQAFAAEAGRADAATKQRMFAQFLDPKSVPEDWVVAAVRPFNAGRQTELTRPYLKPALEALPKLKRERKIFFILGWLAAFLGGQGDAEALEVVRAYLRDAKPEPDLERKVLEAADELERAVKIRAKFDNR